MTHKIGVIAGDGIGREVIPAGIAAIEAATKGTGISLTFTELPWGCDYYTRHGRMMEEGGFEKAAGFDAIYLGAIGDPKVPDHIAVWELLLPLRQRFQQYVNLRPLRLLRGVTSPLANRGPADIDMVCVRVKIPKVSTQASAAVFTSGRRMKWRSRPDSSRGTVSSASCALASRRR